MEPRWVFRVHLLVEDVLVGEMDVTGVCVKRSNENFVEEAVVFARR